MSEFTLSRRSLGELSGVHEDLAAIVRRAIKISSVDFAVHDGIRSRAEQRALVASGASRTMDSRHLTGHAVDLVPYVNHKLRWEWEPIYTIAAAMQICANQAEVPLRWGGVWDRGLNDLDTDVETAVSMYVDRRRAMGRKAFIDGPHFELPRDDYPA